MTVAGLVDGGSIRAAQFIVTVYGDAVEPRGGRLWMGTLIEVCALVGISETRVRTAVSRLVAAGRLAGERDGRRSFYRLTETAQAEFAEAAALIFFGGPPATGWLIVRPVEAATGDALAAAGFVPLGGGLLIGPDRATSPVGGGLVLTAAVRSGDMRAIAAERWDLGRVADTYCAFLARFGPLAAAEISDGQAAFTARTLLVHHYRAALLGDPRLPSEALPTDWPAPRARALFVELYRRLSPAADSYVSRTFVDREGPLPRENAATRRRLALLGAGISETSP